MSRNNSLPASPRLYHSQEAPTGPKSAQKWQSKSLVMQKRATIKRINKLVKSMGKNNMKYKGIESRIMNDIETNRLEFDGRQLI